MKDNGAMSLSAVRVQISKESFKIDDNLLMRCMFCSEHILE